LIRKAIKNNTWAVSQEMLIIKINYFTNSKIVHKIKTVAKGLELVSYNEIS